MNTHQQFLENWLEKLRTLTSVSPQAEWPGADLFDEGMEAVYSEKNCYDCGKDIVDGNGYKGLCWHCEMH